MSFVQNGLTNPIASGINQPAITGVSATNSLITIFGVDANVTPVAPTDSAGQIWSIVKTFVNASGSGAIAWLPAANAGTHTLSWATAAVASESAISEWSGLVSVGGTPLTSSATAATQTTGTYTPASANEVVISFMWELGNGANDLIACTTPGFQGIGTLTDNTPHPCWAVNQNGNTFNGVEANAQIISAATPLNCAYGYNVSIFGFTIIAGFTIGTATPLPFMGQICN